MTYWSTFSTLNSRIAFLMIVSDNRKEIEILSLPYDNGGVLPDGAEKELAPYLFAENSLGIPKKILVKAFLSARTILNTCINQKINFGISLWLRKLS